jgi:hypothetical protein
MRRQSAIFVLPAIALLLASCGSPFRAGGPIISGRVQDVSNADIQVAVAAYQTSIRYAPAPIGEIEVISHDEVRIHDDPAPSNYTSMLRVNGKWQLGSVVLVHPGY